MKHPSYLIRSVLTVTALTVLAAATGFAQDTPDKNDPVRGVRLSDVEGSVSLFQGDQQLTDAATANVTLYEGTKLTATNNGRSEIQFDEGSIVRLTPASTLSLNLLRQQGEQTETEVELNSGLGYFELKPERDNSGFRVKFGDNLITATQESTIRVNFDNAPGSVAVFSGEVHVENSHGLSVDVHGGQNLALDASDPSRFSLTQQLPNDSWDNWNHDRDLALAGNASQQTPTTKQLAKGADPAWNDLDANGNWYNVPDVGQVWSPTEAAYDGWDPYGSGYWMWRPRFGYVWVSSYSWGYLPYRCGYWNWYDNFGWGWAPGGCGNPWFVGGFWYANFHYWPGWYHVPHWPGRGWGGGRGGRDGRPGIAPRIPVNRGGGPGGRMIRPLNGQVNIAGHSVSPVRPMNPRSSYGQFNSRMGFNAGAGNRGGYSGTGNVGARPGFNGYSGGNPGVARPGATPGGVYRPQGTPQGGSAPRPSGGGSAPRSPGGSSGGSTARPSGGGGGHSNFGGGGGGGGGSHAGGGGGHHR